jgi:hypothetical protein
MELDAVAAELLYAVAATIMLGSMGVSSDAHQTIVQKIALVERQMEELEGEVEHQSAREPTLKGPYF